VGTRIRLIIGVFSSGATLMANCDGQRQKIAGACAPRTIANRSNFLKIFFLHKKIAWPLAKTDRVSYTEKAVSAYQPEEINKLLEFANEEESALIQFFLFTGARDREVQFATWRDVNFSAKTFSVTEKLDLGFNPKDKEEGDIPIPDSLVDLLRERRQKFPDTRFIFSSVDSKADRHFLRAVKKLALRAGMNCGCCYNKAGQCCANKPVCALVGLHRFRKLHRSGRVRGRRLPLPGWLARARC
jgi:integrase/recombinase XerD